MKYKILLPILCISIVSVVFFFKEVQKMPDGKLHVIFCDVGQGDGVIVKTPTGKILLFDGGPNDRILSCLSNQLPFWRKDIALVYLSHPHVDHFLGFIGIFKAYEVRKFVTEKLVNTIAPYETLIQQVKQEGITPTYLYTGDTFTTKDGVVFTILGPTKQLLQQTSPGSTISEAKEFANLITQLQFGEFSLLLPGDSQSMQISSVLQSKSANIEIIQVPHHGSGFGLSQEIFDKISPKLAVISVGVKNRYGHPASSTIKLLKDNHIRVLRTDQQGDIEIVTDGKRWYVK